MHPRKGAACRGATLKPPAGPTTRRQPGNLMFSFLRSLLKKPPVVKKAAPVSGRAAQQNVITPPEKRTVREGDSGEDVKTLQRILKDHGFFDGMTVSGQFGPKTRSAVVAFQQTHIGEDREPLLTDGIVGPRTWWALYNPSGAPQRQRIADKAPSQQSILTRVGSVDRKAVLDQAFLLYVAGTHEIPDGSNTGDGVTKFHQWFGMSPAQWCAMAVNWIVFQALGRLPWGAKQAHVATFWRLAKGKAMAKPLGNYRPIPGDLFVMVHRDDTGHIGIVSRVSEDGKTLEVFEGNTGNRFALRRRAVGAGDHVGYINPYGDAANPPSFDRGLTTAATAAPSNTR